MIPTSPKTKALVARFAIAAIAFAGLVPLASAAITPVFTLSDVVTSGEGQNVFASDSSTFTGTTSTQLVYNSAAATGGVSYLVIKFPEAVSLTNVGDKVTLDWTVALTNGGTTGGQAFRLGIFDVGTATTGTFGSSTGYRADYGSATNNRGFYERTGSNGNLFGSGAYTQFDPTAYDYSRGSFSLALNASGTVTFSGTFSIELLAGDKVQISTQLGTGVVAGIIDDAGAFKTFNSVSIMTADGGAAGTNVLKFSDLTVNLSTIPEPAAAAAWLSGIVAFVGVMIRRRRCG